MASRSIPGTSRSSVPGSRNASVPTRSFSGFLTRVPRQSTSAQFSQLHRRQIRDAKGRFAGGWGFAWQGLEALDDRLYLYNDKIHANIRQAAESLAEEIQQYMYDNAPWQDQTGNAREGLQAVVTWADPDHFSIFLGHGDTIDYGIWLEVRWGGRFAIIVPTAHLYAPQLGARIAAGF